MGRIAAIVLLLLVTGLGWALARPSPASLAPATAIVSVRTGSVGSGGSYGTTHRSTSRRSRRSHVGGGIHFGK